MVTLRKAGVKGVGAVPTINPALTAIIETTKFAAVLLDIDLDGVQSFSVVCFPPSRGLGRDFANMFEIAL